MKEQIRKKLLETGAAAVGFCIAGEIDSAVHEDYKNWVKKGFNGEMAYLERHIPLRHSTQNVLPDTRTVISLAYSYVPEKWRSLDLPMISVYAYGEDYHKLLRKILKPVVKEFETTYGGKWRICIDSAPVAERFWAMKSGIGKRFINGCIGVENCGTLCFLVEILTTLEFDADQPSNTKCKECMECVKSCPSGALLGNGSMDAGKCINYLMIEKKSPLTSTEKQLLEKKPGFILGCDICQRVCPHNRDLPPGQLFHNRYPI
ncbi:MAG: DUF1730 domain-containing protein [Muribaculaceae bacterium]|nr:DUF1730 domain-containing protein [Muribaculaceae bacterium]